MQFASCRLVFSLLFGVLLCGLAAGTSAQEIPYSTADWPRNMGNHRARVEVTAAADAVFVRIPWRRRDPDPENKAIRIVDVATGGRIKNVLPLDINREFGGLVFQPKTAPGVYDVYYMPYQHAGPPHQFRTDYRPPEDTADSAWAGRVTSRSPQDFPQGRVIAFQARSDFDRFDPMEIIATAAEAKALLREHPAPCLLFPENRRYPIRMSADLPQRWIQSGPSQPLRDTVQPGEFYPFQIGIFAARQPIASMAVTCNGLSAEGGASLPAAAFRCFNLGGTDWLGRPMEKSFSVEQGQVRALWFGVQVPEDATPGTYRGSVTVRPEGGASEDVLLELQVSGAVLADAGDSELWRLSRLRWLDSTIGIDDQVVAPYTALEVRDNTVSCLGRSVRFGDDACIESIRSNEREILAAPIRFIVETAEGAPPWPLGITKTGTQSPGRCTFHRNTTAAPLTLEVSSTIEFDGYINCRATLRATETTELRDVRLEIPLRRDVATYMMGMGRKGGYRPESWTWTWAPDRANNSLWVGDVDAGLHCKLKGPEDRWELYRLGHDGLPDAWHNSGQGQCAVTEEAGDRVVIRASSGPRTLAAGAALTFCFGLLVTPVKPLDQRHWSWRYYHRGSDPDLETAVDAGTSIINIHHGGALNPHINYPFIATEELGAYVKAAHDNGMKVKVYYTVRELSNHCAELFPLRSLGFEVFSDGPGGGASWLHEHLGGHYAPAWHESKLPSGKVDAALGTTGLSRWHNYYLEGLRWLLENVAIDGLYLDGIGYNREIMKRVRKVMERTRPGALIDFHSGNNFHPNYGLSNCANQYLEHFPYLDSLWFGEGFDYNESPDYWLVEISGLPFGLYGEMLQGGGNPWRGMIYGMTSRLGWGGDPRPIWKVWDDFGIADADMKGYWHADCPIKTNHESVLATAYCKPGKTLVALASWAPEAVSCQLAIDWQALGLDPQQATLTAPELPDFQPHTTFGPADPVPVEPGRGWLLLMR